MPDNLTNYAENALIEAACLGTTLEVSLPLELALLQVQGGESLAGTEVTGGSYARPTIVLDVTGSSNTGLLDGDVTITDMPACDVQGWAIYDADGNRWWYGLWAPKTGSAQNTGDTVTVTNHGYTSGQKVTFQEGFVPPNLNAGTTYYVKNPTTHTFQVSTTNGGTASTISGDSASIVVGKVLTVLASDDFDIADGNLSVSLT